MCEQPFAGSPVLYDGESVQELIDRRRLTGRRQLNDEMQALAFEVYRRVKSGELVLTLDSKTVDHIDIVGLLTILFAHQAKWAWSSHISTGVAKASVVAEWLRNPSTYTTRGKALRDTVIQEAFQWLKSR